MSGAQLWCPENLKFVRVLVILENDHKNKGEFFYIQGLPSLNVGTLPSCTGPQIKKNNVKLFANSQIFFEKFFAKFWNFFNINVCFKVHSFSYNNSILHNFFINDPH